MQVVSDYKDLAKDLARATCRVNCLLALRDQKGITKRKWQEYQREFKKASKEQNSITTQIFNNDIEDPHG